MSPLLLGERDSIVMRTIVLILRFSVITVNIKIFNQIKNCFILNISSILFHLKMPLNSPMYLKINLFNKISLKMLYLNIFELRKLTSLIATTLPLPLEIVSVLLLFYYISILIFILKYI